MRMGRVEKDTQTHSYSAKRKISEGAWDLVLMILMIVTAYYYLLYQRYFPELLLCAKHCAN